MAKEKKKDAVNEKEKASKKVTKKVIAKQSTVQKIRTQESNEIEKQIVELKQEHFNLRFQAAVGKLENTAQLRKVKKDIARAYTVLTEREKARV